jgi:ADP-ribosylglycohydrolase
LKYFNVVDCLEAGLWCFWTIGNFRDAILKSANLGDDADTTAAVCGQIAGAYYGSSGIPEAWKVLHSDSFSIESGWLFSQAVPSCIM